MSFSLCRGEYLSFFFCIKNKKILMNRSMNILIISLTTPITKLSSFCLEIFSSYFALSAFRNISYLLQTKFALLIVISFVFSRNKAIISTKEIAPY